MTPTLRRAEEARLPPETYRSAFEAWPDGAAVLAELTELFGADLYVPGGQDAERQTLVNLGRRQVLDFILQRINAGK